MTDYWFHQPCTPPDKQAIQDARAHQLVLTKPAGSLGLLEDLAIQFSGWQSTNQPSCENIQICVFAGDHGVCEHGVSAFPQEVTGQMVQNFVAGGAAISVMAKQLNADFRVVNMGVASDVKDAPILINSPLARGTSDFTKSPAMNLTTTLRALEAGRNQIGKDETLRVKPDLFIGGDMGIGNTTSASAIYSLLLELPPESTVGPGTGIDQNGITAKQSVLAKAIKLHAEAAGDPLQVLQRVGGLEIAGLTGAYIECAQQGIPILVDGFITTAAALLACKINPDLSSIRPFDQNGAATA